MSIPVTPRRTEPLLLPKLRTLFPDVTFDTIERSDLEPPFTEATLADSMQGMSTPISQYVRLRLSVRCMREDHTGDWDKAARVWAAIAREIIGLGNVAPLIDASLESGPVRMTDEDKRLVCAYGVLLLPKGDSMFVAPTGVAWTPPASKKPIGYSTEDGAVLHPEPGDSTDYKAHNGDIVLSDTDPGYWTLQLAAMEGRKDVVSAYFDVDVDSDGGISIKGAGLKKEWILVMVALDQQDRPFLLYGTNAKVSDRDDVSLKSSEIMNFSMTFKMLKGTNGEQFHAWGLVTEDAK